MHSNKRSLKTLLRSATEIHKDNPPASLPTVRLTCPPEDGFLSYPIDVCLLNDITTSPDSSSVPSSPCLSTSSSSSFTPSSCSSVTSSPDPSNQSSLLAPGCPYIDDGRSSIENCCSNSTAECSGRSKFLRNKVSAQWKALNQLRSSFDATHERNDETSVVNKPEIVRTMSLRKSRLQIPFRRSTAALPKFSCPSPNHAGMNESLAAAEDSANESQRSLRDGTKRLFNKKSKGHRRPSSQWGTFLNVFADVLRFRKTKSREWFQLGGHKGTFREGLRNSSLLKAHNENERQQYISMQCDVICEFIPKFYGLVKDDDGKEFIELEDLLYPFKNPSVMDVKMGVRTYLESDVSRDDKGSIMREDLYQKMISVDDKEPTEEENLRKAISKPRYMLWRENLSSTTILGFRIEAIKKANDEAMKDFQRSKTRDDVAKHLKYFVNESISITDRFLKRLKQIRNCLTNSLYFNTHEVIGSSLLFVYDKQNIGVWLIDFAKTIPLPNGVCTTHLVPWTPSSHEDGYLIGLDNLIAILQDVRLELSTANT